MCVIHIVLYASCAGYAAFYNQASSNGVLSSVGMMPWSLSRGCAACTLARPEPSGRMRHVFELLHCYRVLLLMGVMLLVLHGLACGPRRCLGGKVSGRV